MTAHPIRIGVCYYPEHWPEERWAIDAAMMAGLGLDCVRIAEFAWAKMEPAEGRFDFAWLHRAVETLAAAGLDVILGTPTATPPRWLTTAYPEALQWDARGVVRGPGSRRQACASSPRYRELSRRIVTRMAAEFGQHPAVIGWQIDNEFGAHDSVRCHNPACDNAFRAWARTRYESLDALNDAWGTVFWSGTFTSWDQVETLKHTPADHQPGPALDFRRFSSENWVSFQREQVDILRERSPGRWITHNCMGWFGDLDYYDIARDLDFVSWDNYVTETSPRHAASQHDLMRGLKRRPFWVMEQQMGKINWWRYNPALAPGEVRERCWQDIARGADGIVYFRWRQVNFGSEQYHSGLLRNDGSPSRAFEEIRQFITGVREVEDRLAGTMPVAEAAILHSYEDRWALELDPQTRDLRGWNALQATFFAAHRALWRRGLTADFLEPMADLSGYPLVVAPMLLIATPALAEHLEAFVRSGGTLILGPRSGSKTPENTTGWLLPPGPLTSLCGAVVEEYDAPPPSESFSVAFNHVVTPAATWRDILGPRGAEIVATYSGGTFDALPAITAHRIGDGVVILVGTVLDDQGWAALFDLLGDRMPAGAGAPPGVEVVRRAGDGKQATIAINHGPDTVDFDGIQLPPREVLVR